MSLDEEGVRVRFLIRDRDSKFSASFDEVFRSQGIRVIRAPIRAPRARAHAERWVGTLRRECLDRLLIFGRRRLESAIGVYVQHDNEHRPHRSLAQRVGCINAIPLQIGKIPVRVRVSAPHAFGDGAVARVRKRLRIPADEPARDDRGGLLHAPPLVGIDAPTTVEPSKMA